MNNEIAHVRNFLITAHVDHGKSTLADRLLEITGTIEKRLMKPQYLDQLELERERGITIKMAPVRMVYRPAQFPISNLQFTNNLKIENSKIENSNSEYILNLIDTPGHSDFTYEVSRALAAVEGAVLLVDATQGVQAQTLANFENAQRAGLVMIGAVNKIDIAAPEQIEAAVKELSNLLNISDSEILRVSGKTGEGVELLLEKIIAKIPPPRSSEAQLQKIGRALIFDSLYDEHRGVIAFARVMDGEFNIQGAPNFHLLATETDFKPKEIGYFSPALQSSGILKMGEIGYIATGLKDPGKLKIGDTVIANIPHLTSGISQLALSGYHEPKPLVFVSIYPEDSGKYEELKQALAKLRLTDSALQFDVDFSDVLGRGFKGGFLGKLHFEITAERLQREFYIPIVTSFPSVAYKVHTNAGWLDIQNPRDFPADFLEVMEPIARLEILSQPQYLGEILQLKQIFRFSDLETFTLNKKVLIKAKLPLADLVSDLEDKLKSVSAGYASFSYEILGFEKSDVVKMEILLVGKPVPGLTRIIPRADIEREGRIMVERLRDLLPRQQFTQAIQAAVSGRIIARETIPAMRKLLGNFGKTGGDRTRKMKLWKKQQKGKRKLQERAEQSQVKIPAHIFKELMKK